jgi:hypothetical protein
LTGIFISSRNKYNHHMKLTKADLDKLLNKTRKPRDANYRFRETIRKIIEENDLFQRGKLWIGAMPSDLSDPDVQEILGLVESKQVTVNLIKQVVKRKALAVTGVTPNWSVTLKRTLKTVSEKDPLTGFDVEKPERPSEEEQNLIDLANRVLMAFWENNKPMRAIREAARDACAYGRGVVALIIPEEKTTLDKKGDSVLIGTTLEDFGKAVMPLRVDGREAGVYFSKNEVPLFSYRHYSDEDDTKRHEISRLEQDGRTHIYDVERLNTDSQRGVAYPIDGELMMYELKIEPIVSPAALSAQNLVTHAASMMNHNVSSAGFIERTFINAMKNGRFERDPQTGLRSYIEEPYKLGAKTITHLVGLEQTDSEGGKTYANPNVVYKEASDSGAFINPIDAGRMLVYEEVSQMHVLIQGNATPSGVSRQTAMLDFTMDTADLKEETEGLVRWMLKVVLRLAAYNNNEPDLFNDLRITCECIVNTTEPTPEDIQADISLKQEGAMSTNTLMARSGRIVDVDAEQAKINEEKAISLAQQAPIEDPAAPTNKKPEPKPKA